MNSIYLEKEFGKNNVMNSFCTICNILVVGFRTYSHFFKGNLTIHILSHNDYEIWEVIIQQFSFGAPIQFIMHLIDQSIDL